MNKYSYETIDALKYTCPDCGKTFTSVSESQIEWNIDRHREAKHKEYQ